MLGEVPTREVVQESDTGALQKSLLGVDRRCCNTHTSWSGSTLISVVVLSGF